VADVHVRQLGVEEELLVVDPRTWRAASRAGEVLAGRDDLEAELFRHQVEVQTQPTTDVDELVSAVVRRRRSAGEAAASHGLAVAASASVPHGIERPEVTPDDRYRAIVEQFGDVALLGTTCGMHVHVAIESDEEGVACLDRIAPWLPVLLAASANSPFAGGHDTGYASWRTQLWSAWPSAGPTEAFGDVDGYRRACRRMIASGAARDRAMLYLDARLSARHPTLEVRVLDVVVDPDDTALLACLVRALVETAAEQWRAGAEAPRWRCEELRAARWRAARDGLSGRLLDPVTHGLRPARDVVMSLRDLVAPRLEAAAESRRVDEGLARVLAGTGASRQRAARERSGSIEGVVEDLVERTARSWG
jgi:glutamate---cysteine ligase / carboxylate-amine ligase